MLDLAALKQYISSHPKLKAQDIIKFLYQGEFGCGHLIPDYSDAYQRFCAEWDCAKNNGEDVFQRINHNFYRVNLGAAKENGMSMSLILRMFFSSAIVCGNKSDLASQLDYVLSMAENGEINIDAAELLTQITNYKAADMPLISHSREYAASYAPSYRVIKAEYALFAPVFTAMYGILHDNPAPVILIDGMAAAGKTTLAQLISSIIPCNVVQADSFFLPAELRTEQRLSQPGGNIDYLRIKEEIAKRLPCTEDIYYGVFSCKKMDILGEGRIIGGLPVIIEGSYSCHPKAEIKADLKIMLKTTAEKQLQRILARNGKTMCHKFENIWIPMENKYFDAFSLEKNVDFVFET